jgi:hypothetical protein
MFKGYTLMRSLHKEIFLHQEHQEIFLYQNLNIVLLSNIKNAVFIRISKLIYINHLV